LYSEHKITDLPTAEFYVAYNGAKPLKEDISEFYKKSTNILIKATVNIVNIHFDNLQDTKTDNALAGYSFFYKVFDECRQAGLSADDSFNQAKQECISHGYLMGFIDREEFVMLYKDILDYDTQLKEEGKIEGAEKTISVAIRSKAPFSLIEAMAKEAKISKKRLDELMTHAAV